MVKTLFEDSTYEPDKRSHNWLKIKKDYLDGVTDTLDLIPIGAYYGKGKRTGVYGTFLLACVDRDNDEFNAICKVATGFSDEDLASLTESLREHITDRPSVNIKLPEGSKNVCDVWFSPCQVWEILAADLSISPIYPAAIGLVSMDRGIALRFPRFIRARPDKDPLDATDTYQIAELFRTQSSRAGIHSTTTIKDCALTYNHY
jgi:DNA ligase-1